MPGIRLPYPLQGCDIDSAEGMMRSAAQVLATQAHRLQAVDIASIAAALNKMPKQAGHPSTAVLVDGTGMTFDFRAGGTGPDNPLPIEIQQVVVLYQLTDDELYPGSDGRLVALIYIPRDRQIPNQLESGYVDYKGYRPGARVDRKSTEYNASMMKLMADFAHRYRRRWPPFRQEDWHDLYNLNPPYDRVPPRNRGRLPTDWVQGLPWMGQQREGGVPVMAALAVKKRLHLDFPPNPRSTALPVEFYNPYQYRLVHPGMDCETWEQLLALEMTRIADEWRE